MPRLLPTALRPCPAELGLAGDDVRDVQVPLDVTQRRSHRRLFRRARQPDVLPSIRPAARIDEFCRRDAHGAAERMMASTSSVARIASRRASTAGASG